MFEGERRSILDVVRVEDGDTELLLKPWRWPKGIVFSSDESQLVQIFDGGVVHLALELHDLENNESATVEGRPYYHMFGPAVLRFIHDDRLIEVSGLTQHILPSWYAPPRLRIFALFGMRDAFPATRNGAFVRSLLRGRQTMLQVFEISPEIAARATDEHRRQPTNSRMTRCFILVRLRSPMMGGLW